MAKNSRQDLDWPDKMWWHTPCLHHPVSSWSRLVEYNYHDTLQACFIEGKKKYIVVSPTPSPLVNPVCLGFTNSLRKLSNQHLQRRRFGYLVFKTSIDYYDFFLRLRLLSFCFDWEDISNTRESVSSDITPQISSRNTPLRVVFSTLISRWNTLSCLIHYIMYAILASHPGE